MSRFVFSFLPSSLSEEGLGSDFGSGLPFPLFLSPLRSTCSVVEVERYKPLIPSALSGSLYLIGVVDVANELCAYLGVYAAFRGFLPMLTRVELSGQSSSSSSGLLLVMQPDNARFHHGFRREGVERIE